MQSKYPRWFVAISRELPEERFRDGIILNEGFPDDYEPIQTDLNFMILCRTIEEKEYESNEIINRELKALGLDQLKEIHQIVPRIKYITRREKNVIKKMKSDELSIREFFIGIKKNSKEAQQSAKEIIEEAITRKPWEVWK